MTLADDFQAVLDTLPPDWTQLQFDFRIAPEDEERYVELAPLVAQMNAWPHSRSDWHWRVNVAREFGHAAAPETVKGTLKLLDDEGVHGELEVREVRAGRSEVVQLWGRPESVREEFFRRRAQ